MKTITVNLYSYDELSEKAKEKALEEMKDINTNYDWWDAVYDDAKEIGKLMGIEIDEIYFSGFWSQGDGACFEGTYSYKKDSVNAVKEYAPSDTEVQEIAKNLFDIQKKHFYQLTAGVKHSGRYSHENSTDIAVFNKDSSSEYQVDCEELEKELRSFMKWIYSQLEKQYDYLSSKAVIEDTINSNDYYFSEDGSFGKKVYE